MSGLLGFLQQRPQQPTPQQQPQQPQGQSANPYLDALRQVWARYTAPQQKPMAPPASQMPQLTAPGRPGNLPLPPPPPPQRGPFGPLSSIKVDFHAPETQE